MGRRVEDALAGAVLAPGADALLGRGSAVVVALLEAEEDVLELVHSGVGEQQRRIVRRPERRGAHDAVAALVEEVEIALTNFVSGHWIPSERIVFLIVAFRG